MIPKKCSVIGCDRKYLARGWCQLHYERWRMETPKRKKWLHSKEGRLFAAKRQKRYRDNHPEKIAIYGRSDKERFRKMILQRKMREKPDFREKRRIYRRRPEVRAKEQNYQRRVRNRIPAWANKNKIAEFYMRAEKLGLHVDHIIPLKHSMVSGLHVETNLQLLTPKQNCTKRNIWPWPNK